MAKIILVRVDSRLIHGQVMTMWSKINQINHILAIDDPLSQDEFLQKVYLMAVPKSLKVTILSVEEASKKWLNNELDPDNYLVLIKDVETALRVWKSGFEIRRLQIGNVICESKTGILHRNSRLSREHMPFLMEMLEGGVDVYAQSIPTEREVRIDQFLKK